MNLRQLLTGLSTFGLMALATACNSSATHVGRLRCEYLENPMGLGERRPRLSWELNSDERGQRQAAYRVVVASSKEKLARGQGDLWDSGRVESAETTQVEYAGKELGSRQGVYWTVTSWDQDGRVAKAQMPGMWEMGLLDGQEWGGKWIGAGKDALVAPAPMLRREFEARGKVTNARAYVTGVGYYELHLNGKKVGDHVLDPGYTRFDKRVLYATYDVTEQVKRGKNAVGVMLGTGWYEVHTLAVWNFEQAPWRGAPAARVRLEVEYADGGKDVVVSDEGWKLGSGPIVYDSIYGGEFYDARLEKKGWDEAGYDDSGWKGASVMEGPKGTLVAPDMRPIRVTAVVTPKSVKEVKPGVFVVDMGRNFAGVPELRVTGPAGATVKMRCGERLGADSGLHQDEIDVYVKKRGADQAFQEARYTLKGDGTEVWSPRFSYMGFQYVEVTGFPGRPTVENFRGLVMHSDVESVGRFRCSNPVLNWIDDAARAAYLSNLHSIPTDCPTREKNGWTGDAHLAAEMAMYHFDPLPLYAKWMNDFDDAQGAAGDLPGIIPSGGWGYGKQIGPAWDTAYFHIPWYVYLYYGDTRMLERHYPRLAKYVDYVTANREKDGTVSFGLGDWAPYEAQTPFPLTSTAYYYRDLVILSEAAKVLGKGEDARKYKDMAEGVKVAFIKRFFDDKNETYANGTQTALSCALYQGLVPAGHEGAVFANLVKAVEAKKNHLDCGILGTKYLLNVLLDHGRADLAYAVVAQTDLPSWGYWMKEKGATTLYESWKDVDSRNHIMFGDVSAWFFRALAGIRPDEKRPGFRHVLIRPQVVGDLTEAAGEVHTVRGVISSSWKRVGDRVEMEVKLPANVTASVWVPGEAAAREVGSGTYRITGVAK